MTLPRKGSRRITANGETYRWTVSPDSGCMWLIVERADIAGQRLETGFGYQDLPVAGPHLIQQQRIQPATVRRSIEAALRLGWRPATPHLPPFRLDDAENQNETGA